MDSRHLIAVNAIDGVIIATGGATGPGIGGGRNGNGSNITVSGDAQTKAQSGEATNNSATGAAVSDGVQYRSDNPGREETPKTAALNEGWIATYAPGVTDTIPDPGSKLVRAAAPLYRVVDQDGKALACKAEQKDGVLTVTAEADFAALTGTLGGVRTLQARGVDTIVFVTNGAVSTFALSDLLAQGGAGDTYTLTHDGAAVTFTLNDGADVSKILQ